MIRKKSRSGSPSLYTRQRWADLSTLVIQPQFCGPWTYPPRTTTNHHKRDHNIQWSLFLEDLLGGIHAFRDSAYSSWPHNTCHADVVVEDWGTNKPDMVPTSWNPLSNSPNSKAYICTLCIAITNVIDWVLILCQEESVLTQPHHQNNNYFCLPKTRNSPSAQSCNAVIRVLSSLRVLSLMCGRGKRLSTDEGLAQGHQK